MGLFGNLTGNGKSFSDSLKYVDDYKTELVTDEKGRTRKRTFYIGNWSVIKGDPASAKAKIFGAAALGVASAVLLVLMLLRNHSGFSWLPVSVPKVLAVFPMLYLIMGVIDLPYRIKPMHRDRYMHSFIRMSRSGVAVMAMVGVSLAAVGVWRIINKDGLFLKDDWIYIGLCAALFVALGVMLALLYNVEVEEKPNSHYSEPEAK